MSAQGVPFQMATGSLFILPLPSLFKESSWRAARRFAASGRQVLESLLMIGLLARVGVDSSSQDFGNWNAPVNPDLSFVYVPIPEWYEQRQGMETPYTAVEPRLRAVGKPLPAHLRLRNMHVSPDFACLTYGDYDEKPGCRGRCLERLKPGDFVVFYASFEPTERIANNNDTKFYALFGQMFVEEIVPYGRIAQDRYHENAKTRCEEYRYCQNCLILRADPARSGRYSRCIHFAHWRNGAYRVFPELLDRWGNILKLNGEPVSDGWVQRPSWLPSVGDPDGFLEWLKEQETGGLRRSNWDSSSRTRRIHSAVGVQPAGREPRRGETKLTQPSRSRHVTGPESRAAEPLEAPRPRLRFRTTDISEGEAQAYVAAYLRSLRDGGYTGSSISCGRRWSIRFMHWFLGLPLPKGKIAWRDLKESESGQADACMKNLSEAQAKSLVRDFVRHEETVGYRDPADIHNETVWFMLFMRGSFLSYGTGLQTLPSGWKYHDIQGS